MERKSSREKIIEKKTKNHANLIESIENSLVDWWKFVFELNTGPRSEKL